MQNRPSVPSSKLGHPGTPWLSFADFRDLQFPESGLRQRERAAMAGPQREVESFSLDYIKESTEAGALKDE